MNKVIKEFLTDKSMRNKASLLTLIATFMAAGLPWGGAA
jgi:hypothetical protein